MGETFMKLIGTKRIMASDCTVAIDDGYINLRVGAIIMKNGKFLMVGNQKDNYLYSVGGRIQFGETAEEAIVREVFEETGVKLEIDRLGFIHENFFYGDYNSKERLIWVDENSEITYYPTFFREELKRPSAGVKHIVTDRRIKE